MIGVVVWSDRSKNRAVIWCEDQGDLAFYRTDSQDAPDLRDGDCVTFKVEQDGELRHAKDLTLLEEETHPALSTYLADVGRPDTAVSFPATTYVAPPVPKMGEIVPFPQKAHAKKRNTARAGTVRSVIQAS